MKLFYTKGACSLAVRIVLNELNVSYESVSVDLRTKKTETGADYFQINSKGAVPALQLENGTLITENAVIQQYLADTYQAYNLLPEVGDIKRYHVLTWLNYVSTELHKGCSPFFNPNMPAEINQNVFLPMLKAKLSFVEKQLQSTQGYLSGENFTLPDSYLFTVLTWLRGINIDIAEWPTLQSYVSKLQTRPSVKLALEQEGLPLPIR